MFKNHIKKSQIKTLAKKTKPPVKKRNWKVYEAEQKRRYDLEVWFDEETLSNWFNTNGSYGAKRRGYKYSANTILMVLGIGALFKQPLRGAEHFTNSLLKLMGYPQLKAPDHSTLCRARKRLCIPLAPRLSKDPRVIMFDGTGVKVFGAGEWLRTKHTVQKNTKWRRLTVCVDYDSGQILDFTLQPSSGSGSGETSQAVAMLDDMQPEWSQSVEEIIGDGAYDKKSMYQAADKLKAWLITPPQWNAGYGLHPVRDQHIKTMNWHGKKEWKQRVDYGRRSLVETRMSCIKQITGERLRSRSLQAQRAEIAVRLMALNRVTNPAVQLRNG